MGKPVKADYLVCQAKEAFATFHLIEAHLKLREKRDGFASRPYHCRVCGQWHVTSNRTFDFRKQSRKKKDHRDRHRDNLRKTKPHRHG